MSSESDRLRYEQILRSLLAGRAMIIRNAMQSDWPAHPGGNIRARPIFWVNRVDAEELLERRALVATDKGLELSDPTRRRLLGHAPEHAPDEAAPGLSDHPSVSQRGTGSTIIRLSRCRDRRRVPHLNEAQVRAAERYTRDLVRAGEGHIDTSDLSAPQVDGTRRHDAAERAMLMRIDAGKALASAREAVGPDLARLLNRICRDDEKPDAIDTDKDWPTGMALHMLKMALTRLSGHYRTDPSGEDHPRNEGEFEKPRPRYFRQS